MEFNNENIEIHPVGDSRFLVTDTKFSLYGEGETECEAAQNFVGVVIDERDFYLGKENKTEEDIQKYLQLSEYIESPRFQNLFNFSKDEKSLSKWVKMTKTSAKRRNQPRSN